MRKPLLVLALVALAVPTAARAASRAEDEASIKKVEADFTAAWNRHDPKAMASFWAVDGDLINPFGRWAKGRAEVEKLFQDEQSAVMKGTTYSTTSSSIRFLGPDVAVTDWDIAITGMRGPDGSALPPFKPHLTIVMVRKEGHWACAAARPYEFTSRPDGAK
jgi:uncharacterized protein (TIGR02246 family)